VPKKVGLKKSEGYKLCKMMGGRCGCEDRSARPCQSLVMHLRANGGKADAAFLGWQKSQAFRAEFETKAKEAE
jgi:hypothetical protein